LKRFWQSPLTAGTLQAPAGTVTASRTAMRRQSELWSVLPARTCHVPLPFFAAVFLPPFAIR